MIFFKLPNSETLYTTNSNSNLIEVRFFPFLKSENSIDISGSIEEAQSIEINVNLSKSPDFIAENKAQYLQNLEAVIETIVENNLPKLVYSRRKIVPFNQIELKKSFENICKTYPNAFRYIFYSENECWIGAFSEVLGKYNKKTSEFETMSLAGTLKIDEEWTEKEIEEQKPVTHYIKNILETYSNEVEMSETYTHPSGNIKHLRTDFKANIKTENLDELIANLHPTPAVCGVPKDFCTEKIKEFEIYPRELYAGYIKIEMQDTIYYFVNLRCAKIFENSAHLFVGGGITSQSNPEKEWQETELKSEAVLKNLVIS